MRVNRLRAVLAGILIVIARMLPTRQAVAVERLSLRIGP